MAHVATRSPDRVDALLDSLIEAWHGIPQAAREIDRWDLLDQIDYVEEWGAKLSVMDRIGEQDLTPAQRVRYEEVQRLARKYGALLEQLRQG